MPKTSSTKTVAVSALTMSSPDAVVIGTSALRST